MAKNDIAPRSNRLKALRERSRLTQAEVAKLLDIDVTTVCKHESAQRGLTAPEIAKYAAVFKCQSFELFMEPQAEEAQS